MNKKLLYIIGGIFFLSLLIMQASLPVSAAPQYQTTPTPTPAPEYWLGATISFGVAHWGDGLVTLEPNIPVPEEKEGRGYVIYVSNVNSESTSLKFNTGGNHIFNMAGHQGELVCLDDFGFACSQVGFTRYGWADSFLDGDVHRVLTAPAGVTNTVTFTVQPIYYGIRNDDCEDDDPAQLPVIGEACLNGTDETGNTYELKIGTTYQLVIADDSPWNDGTNERWDMGISFDEGVTWTSARLAVGEDDDIDDNCASEADDQILAIQFNGSEDKQTLQLRVNDADGEFGDNSGDLCYSLYGGWGGPGSCGYALSSDSYHDQIRADDWRGEAILMVDNSSTKAIEIGPPDWTISGGQASMSVELQNNPGDEWVDLRNIPGMICVEEWSDDHHVYYMDSSYMEFMFRLRAVSDPPDTHENYIEHLGVINYGLYNAEFLESTDCTTRYDVGGYLSSGTIRSFGASGGFRILEDDNGLMPDRVTIMIQTSGGPFQERGGLEHYGLEISSTGSLLKHWRNINDVADCIDDVPGFPNQHRYYLRIDNALGDIFLRAQDVTESWTDNSGSMDYTVYAALDMQASPEASCDEMYTLGETLDSQWVSADSDTGAAVTSDNLVYGDHYAIEVKGPDWDIDGNGANDRQLQIKGSRDWYDLADWPGTICSEQTAGQYDRIYFRAGENLPYIRVADPGGNWGDNTGTANWDLKSVEYLLSSDDLTCESNYDPSSRTGKRKFLLLPQFPSLPITDIVEGGVYSIETSDGPWKDGGNNSYDIQISHDGDLWVDLDKYPSDCVIQTGDGGYYTKLYIDPAITSTYFLQVKDTDGIWLNNSGAIYVTITEYVAGTVDTPPPSGFYGGNYSGGCNSICLRPSSWLKAGQWVEYVWCKFQQFVSWCPRHNEMLAAMPDLFKDREPIATFYELSDSLDAVKDEVNSYQWTDDTGGAGSGAPTVGQPENFIFGSDQGGAGQSPFSGEGPYSGEEIGFDFEAASYSSNCINLLADHMGSLMAPGICFAANTMNGLGLTSWFQLVWDLNMLGVIIMYFYNRWVNAFAS